jgi:hypothetical protein
MSDEEGWDGDLRELYESAVDRDSRWRDREEVIEAELLGETEDSENVIKKKVQKAIRTDEKHDEMLTAVASAFNDRSRLTGETGWYVMGVEPLYEVDPSIRNPDAILGHSDREMAVIIECKTGLSEPQNALEQIRGAAENVLEYREYLEEKTGHAFQEVERVLMVPGSLVELAQRAIDQETRENSSENPIFLWTYHTFNEERLRLHRSFNERSETESAHNSSLSQHLSGEGVEVINDPLASGDFHPESNPLKILRNVFFDIPHNRLHSDSSIRNFTRDEVVNIIDDPRTMTHYANGEVAEHICDDLLSRMLNYSLISEDDPEEHGYDGDVELYSYKGTIDGRKPDTIQSNLVEKYKEKWISKKAEREAVERVVDEFMEGQSGLTDYL